eukprot:495031-Hanusia_phi.AAC.1
MEGRVEWMRSKSIRKPPAQSLKLILLLLLLLLLLSLTLLRKLAAWLEVVSELEVSCPPLPPPPYPSMISPGK